MEQMGRFKKGFCNTGNPGSHSWAWIWGFAGDEDSDKAPSKSTGVPIMVPGNFTEIAENVHNGVVNIQAVKNGKSGTWGFRHFAGNPVDNRTLLKTF